MANVLTRKPQRNPSTILGGIGKDASAGGLSAALVILLHGRYPSLSVEEATALMVVGAFVFGVLRRITEDIYARRGYTEDPELDQTPQEKMP